jgi:hypothetical protein
VSMRAYFLFFCNPALLIVISPAAIMHTSYMRVEGGRALIRAESPPSSGPQPLFLLLTPRQVAAVNHMVAPFSR